ncbi:MAG TPA: hypothetical protein VG388_04390 [Solirubrobacteraceae bacterium]|jgi:hypothetical protein|nr:hypothetical protein [Solirubrobacteraceae bacterium]
MSATPPEAKPEDSRGPRGSKERAPISRGLLAGGLIGALLLFVAEFTALYREDSAASRIPLHTVSSGSHHGYALIPVALVALILAAAAARSASRAALLGLGALGLVAALVAVLGDLPDAHAAGFVRTAASEFTKAKNVPGVGFYLETLGAAVLVLTSAAGILFGGGGAGGGAARSARSQTVGTGLSAP